MPSTSDPPRPAIRAADARLSERLGRWWRDLGHALRRWRRAAKAHLPYVRRREFTKLHHKYETLADAVGRRPRVACDARISARKPVEAPLHGDVCLFLCHLDTPALKPHVRHHLHHLLLNNIDVVLILNADDIDAPLEVCAELAGRLRGIYVRENLGFDFAGWAHVHAVIRPLLQVSCLYLVNDSIVGPIGPQGLGGLIERVRASPADLVGLTEARTPVPHLQSFFLAFHRRLADGRALSKFFDTVLCFPDKATVIDVYEMRLTQRLRDEGYRCEALFPALSDDPHASNDTYFRWGELLDLGFPFVKASVLREFGRHRRLQRIAGELVRSRSA
jgi:hypothetical protein